LTEGTELAAQGNVDRRRRVNCRAEPSLQEESELGSGMLTEGTELTGAEC